MGLESGDGTWDLDPAMILESAVGELDRVLGLETAVPAVTVPYFSWHVAE